MLWSVPLGVGRPGREEYPLVHTRLEQNWTKKGKQMQGKNVEETLVLLLFMYVEYMRKCKESAWRNNAEKQI